MWEVCEINQLNIGFSKPKALEVVLSPTTNSLVFFADLANYVISRSFFDFESMQRKDPLTYLRLDISIFGRP